MSPNVEVKDLSFKMSFSLEVWGLFHSVPRVCNQFFNSFGNSTRTNDHFYKVIEIMSMVMMYSYEPTNKKARKKIDLKCFQIYLSLAMERALHCIHLFESVLYNPLSHHHSPFFSFSVIVTFHPNFS